MPARQDRRGCKLIGAGKVGWRRREVVGAVGAIAETLSRLQAEFDVAHRDIKPGNLYELDGSWLIGNLGDGGDWPFGAMVLAGAPHPARVTDDQLVGHGRVEDHA